MDSSNGIGQGQDIPAPSSNVQPVQHDVRPVPEERNFRQSEVNDIVKRAKHDAVESYRRQVTEQPDYAAQKYGDNFSNQRREASSPQTFNEENVRRLAAEVVQNSRDEWIKESQAKFEADNAQRIVQSFWNKIAPGKEKYQDFEKVTGDIEFTQFPNTVQLLAEHIDNSHDVLYELGKDRFKMGQLETLARLSPRDAIIQAQRLSQSLKDNETASKAKFPNEPLNQMRPSNTGTDSGGIMSVRDLRNKYRA